MSELCPKCNQFGERVVRNVNGRRYIYFRHYSSETKTNRWCYIGPLDGYEYVERLHGLRLTNVVDQDYVETAIVSLIKAAERLEKELSRRDKDVNYEKALEIVLEKLFKRIERHRRAVETAYRNVYGGNR